MVSKNVTQNIARLRLKRYLSVMANTKVRKKIFWLLRRYSDRGIFMCNKEIFQ